MRTPPRHSHQGAQGSVEFVRGSDVLTKLTIGTGFRQLPTGLGECQLSRGGHSTAAAVRSSSGMSWLIKSLLFAFRKAVAVLLLAVPMLVAVTPRCAAVTVPALSTIKCYRPAFLVASPSNQDGWFAAFAGVFEPVPVSLHEACVICMFVM